MLVYWILIRLRHFLMTQCVCDGGGGGLEWLGVRVVVGSVRQKKCLLYSLVPSLFDFGHSISCHFLFFFTFTFSFLKVKSVCQGRERLYE